MFHSAHQIRVKLVSNWKQSMLYTKSYHFLHRRKISMLTGLKVSSLSCKCVFYRQSENPMELNFEILEMKHSNGKSLKNRGGKWGHLFS